MGKKRCNASQFRQITTITRTRKDGSVMILQSDSHDAVTPVPAQTHPCIARRSTALARKGEGRLKSGKNQLDRRRNRLPLGHALPVRADLQAQ